MGCETYDEYVDRSIDYEAMNVYELYDLLPYYEQKSIFDLMASRFSFKQLGLALEELIRSEWLSLETQSKEIAKEFGEIKEEIINILEQ